MPACTHACLPVLPSDELCVLHGEVELVRVAQRCFLLQLLLEGKEEGRNEGGEG